MQRLSIARLALVMVLAAKVSAGQVATITPNLQLWVYRPGMSVPRPLSQRQKRKYARQRGQSL